MPDLPIFEALATPGELSAIVGSFTGRGLPVPSDLLEAGGWQVVGLLHDSVQASLGFNQRRHLAGAYRKEFLPGSRRWMVENLSDYDVRFAAAAEQYARDFQAMMGRILGDSQY